MAGGDVTREASSIVFSRSKGPAAASVLICDSIRETFCGEELGAPRAVLDLPV